jgi:hypothetical protein
LDGPVSLVHFPVLVFVVQHYNCICSRFQIADGHCGGAVLDGRQYFSDGLLRRIRETFSSGIDRYGRSAVRVAKIAGNDGNAARGRVGVPRMASASKTEVTACLI